MWASRLDDTTQRVSVSAAHGERWHSFVGADGGTWDGKTLYDNSSGFEEEESRSVTRNSVNYVMLTHARMAAEMAVVNFMMRGFGRGRLRGRVM